MLAELNQAEIPNVQRMLPQAQIELTDGQPYSAAYCDIYHQQDAIVAAQHVFLHGNKLSERFSQESGCFVVAELGLGLGLNLVQTANLWRSRSAQNARLHYIAVESSPPTADQIRRTHALLGSTAEDADWLCEHLAPRWPGWHSRQCGDRIFLTVLHGDALAMLADADFAADAWFLDGFAPSRNPAMWSEHLLAHVGRLSAPAASFATYSVASAVRRHLAGAGFEVAKHPGLAGKREILLGRKPGSKPAATAMQRIAVAGDGIAAAATINALHRRGLNAVKIACKKDSEHAASRVPMFVQTPRVTPAMSVHSRLSMACFAYARQAAANSTRASGALLLAASKTERARQDRITKHTWPASLLEPVDAQQASDKAGVKLACGGLWLPHAAFGESAALLEQVQQVEAIDATVNKVSEADAGVQLSCSAGDIEADAAVLACAGSLPQLLAGLQLPFASKPGLAVQLAAQAASQTRVPLLYGNVLTPVQNSKASWLSLRSNCSADLLQETELDQNLPPGLAGAYRLMGKDYAWSGTRINASDRLPVAGQASDRVHALAALGARGFVLAPLLAEACVAQLTGEPVPLPRSLLKAISPFRFLPDSDRDQI